MDIRGEVSHDGLVSARGQDHEASASLYINPTGVHFRAVRIRFRAGARSKPEVAVNSLVGPDDRLGVDAMRGLYRIERGK